ncbi:MAG: two-component system regulatory protein YycI [Acetivibrionales bacterium]
MDWSKAKTILLITFLILNIFLFVMIMFTGSNQLLKNDYTRYAKDYLASRNIEIKADIPRVSRYTGKVLYSTKKYNVQGLSRLVFGKEASVSESESAINIVVGDEMLNLTEDELYIKDRLTDRETWSGDLKIFEDKLINYLKNLEFNKSDLYLEEATESENAKNIVFTVKYKKVHVFDQQITAQLDKDGFLTISAPAKEIRKENGTGEVLSAYQVLVMGGLAPGSKVVNIDIGYRRISEGDLYGIPVWRIMSDDGVTVLYNGFTGERLD